jgi:hypothetical protein
VGTLIIACNVHSVSCMILSLMSRDKTFLEYCIRYWTWGHWLFLNAIGCFCPQRWRSRKGNSYFYQVLQGTEFRGASTTYGWLESPFLDLWPILLVEYANTWWLSPPDSLSVKKRLHRGWKTSRLLLAWSWGRLSILPNRSLHPLSFWRWTSLFLMDVQLWPLFYVL